MTAVAFDRLAELFAPLAHLLASGGDTRLALDPAVPGLQIEEVHERHLQHLDQRPDALCRMLLEELRRPGEGACAGHAEALLMGGPHVTPPGEREVRENAWEDSMARSWW